MVRFLCSTIHQQYVLQFFACFCFFFQSNFFDEYRIEGKDETNNIYLELVPENLTRAMKSAGSVQAVKIKLTKKHTPCLTFEITLVSVSNMAERLFGKKMLRNLYYCCSFPLTSVNQHLQDDLVGQEKWLWNEMEMERV